MLRIHFTAADLARTKVAQGPDPLWETALSLHRIQTRTGRWAHAEWYRAARRRLHEMGLDKVLRTMLVPMFPRAAYYPDFLNPQEASEGLGAGLTAILDTSSARVRREVQLLALVTGAPTWTARLAERETRQEFTRALRMYHEAVLAPYGERMSARIDAERAARCRSLLDGGVDGLLNGLRPVMRWRPPVLEVHYPARDRDLYLQGRGLLLVPSYFCWNTPMALADPGLPPVLVYPTAHDPLPAPAGAPGAPLSVLLGRTRAMVLRATVNGATTGELARAAGVSSSAASQHTTALRDAGLITSHRDATTVLHTLTPLGASLLRASHTGRHTPRKAAPL